MAMSRVFMALSVVTLALSACGSGGSAGGGGTGSVSSPIFISSATTANVPENSVGTIYQITTNGGLGTVSYSLSGTDAAAFTVNASGAISFRSAPDFEQPSDSDRDNSYLLTVQVADLSGQTSRDLTINVTNVADAVVVSQFGGNYSNIVNIALAPQPPEVLVAQADGTVFSVNPNLSGQGNTYRKIAVAGQRQLLAVAGAPDAPAVNTFYASILTNVGIEVRRFQGFGAGPSDGDLILRIPLPNATTQNVGGWIGFGTDNLLYVATGSGATDATVTPPPNSSLLGKMLRIDPRRDDFPADTIRNYAIPAGNPFVGSGGAGEVYVNGLRDPRAGNFDGTNLYVSDRYETFAGGSGYLYLVRPTDAGRTLAPPGGPAGTLPPVLSGSNNLQSGGTIIAGAVYAGVAPDLVGRYIFGTQGGTGANNFSGIYTVGASSLVPGTTQALRGCCTFLNSNVPVAFAGVGNRDLYFATEIGLFVIQYR